MKETINYIIQQLQGVYPNKELRELAYWIIEETTHLSRTQLLTSPHTCPPIPQLEDILHRLRRHEPIQYIFGHTQWMGLDLRLNANTLIPRPETAELVDWVLASLDHTAPLHIADIGTGCGCIAIALKQRCPAWHITGIDISQEALSMAKQNALHNAVDIQWIQKDILSDTMDTVDVIVSNPPYICHQEKPYMSPRVLDHEPHRALFVPDHDPLLFYRRIASIKAAKYLFFEVNEAYGKAVCEMMTDLTYTDVQLKYDIYGKARMVFGRIEI